jgi:hypothetical protein
LLLPLNIPPNKNSITKNELSSLPEMECLLRFFIKEQEPLQHKCSATINLPNNSVKATQITTTNPRPQKPEFLCGHIYLHHII